MEDAEPTHIDSDLSYPQKFRIPSVSVSETCVWFRSMVDVRAMSSCCPQEFERESTRPDTAMIDREVASNQEVFYFGLCNCYSGSRCGLAHGRRDRRAASRVVND